MTGNLIVFAMGCLAGFIATKWYYVAKAKKTTGAANAGGGSVDSDPGKGSGDAQYT